MITIFEVADMMAAFAATSLVITVIRLVIRKSRNWGWDDLFAVFACLSIVAQAIMLNMSFRGVQITRSVRAKADIYYLNGTFFYFQDWGSRLSILFSLLRICPSRPITVALKVTAVLFVMALAANVGLLIGFCRVDESWARKPGGICPLHKAIPWVQMSTGIASDAVLVVVPFRILQHLTSSTALRRRLQTIFSITILLTIACIIQSIFVIVGPGMPVLVASSTEGFVAIMLCNSTIMITAVIHLFKLDQEKPLSLSQPNSTIVFRRQGTNTVDSETEPSSPETSDKSNFEISGTTTSFGTPGRSFWERWTTMDVDEDIARDQQLATIAIVEELQERPANGFGSIKKQSSFLSEKGQTQTV